MPLDTGVRFAAERRTPLTVRSSFGAALCAAALVALPVSARPLPAAQHAPVVAFLPLVAGDPGLPYSIFPTPGERTALGKRLENIVGRTDGAAVASDARVLRAVSNAGFDQNSTYRSCNAADCARAIGRALHADRVVYGSVTRYLAMIWGTEVSIVDVRSGRATGPFALGYKGDYLSLSMGLPDLAKSLAATIGDRSQARAVHAVAP